MGSVENLLIEVLSQAEDNDLSVAETAALIMSSNVFEAVQVEETQRILDYLVDAGALVSLSPRLGYFFNVKDNVFRPVSKEVFAKAKFVYKTREEEDS